jgi:hypothetical protein
MRLSTDSGYRKLHANFLELAKKVPSSNHRMSEDLQLARVLKYSLVTASEIKTLPPTLEKDRYAYQQIVEKKPEDLRNDLVFAAKQIHSKR